MAWTAPKAWTGGERLYASDLNTYVSDNLADLDPRTVKTFADASARTSGITSPTEGMLSYLADTDAVEVYDGSAWTSIATQDYVTSALSGVTSLRYESGTRSWTVYGSGTEVYAVTFATPFPSAPMIWENHDNEVYDVTFTSVSGTGFTINAPWYAGVPTGAFVRWYALGPA